MKHVWRNLSIFGILLLLLVGVGYVERERVLHLLNPLLQKINIVPLQVHTTDIDFLSGNVQIKGTLYAPDTKFGIYPGVLICHGGTKYGRQLALYVVLARLLAEQGHVVLTFDFRGFGDSEDPHQFDTFSDLDFVQDVSSALTYLTGSTQVDSSRLYVVGHSFGAGVAVLAGIRDYRIGKTVSISPGRCTDQRFFGENAPEPDYPSVRLSYDMKIKPLIPKAILDPHLKDYTAAAFLKFPVHPPILLVDGEHEGQDEMACLQDIYSKMTEPKAYVTIADADHYFGTKRQQKVVIEDIPYDHSIMTELIETLVQWFRNKA